MSLSRFVAKGALGILVLLGHSSCCLYDVATFRSELADITKLSIGAGTSAKNFKQTNHDEKQLAEAKSRYEKAAFLHNSYVDIVARCLSADLSLEAFAKNKVDASAAINTLLSYLQDPAGTLQPKSDDPMVLAAMSALDIIYSRVKADCAATKTAIIQQLNRSKLPSWERVGRSEEEQPR